MPTIEFFGYAEADAVTLTAALRDRARHFSYFADIVVVLSPERSRVVDLHGQARPFVRISSRSQQRADELKDTMLPLSDVETVVIGFTPRTTAAPNA